jgi:succinoglycan biosynthesis transport protein ExoP
LSNQDASQSRSDMSASSGQSANTHALHNFMRVVTRRRIWIIVPFMICVLMAITLTMFMKRTYESFATMVLNKNGSGVDLGIGDELGSSLGQSNDTLMTDLQTETAILQDDSLALAVIEKLKLASQPPFVAKGGQTGDDNSENGLSLDQAPKTRTRLLTIFRGRLKVLPGRGTRLIQVSFESHDQNQAARVANALIDAYKSHYLQSHYEATTETSSWLTTQLSDLKANVEDSEKKLTDFEKANGILSFNIEGGGSGGSDSSGNGSGGGSGAEIHSPIIQKLDALTLELTQAEANRIGKEAIYRLAQSGNADVVLSLQNTPLAVQGGSAVLTQGGGLSNLQLLRQEQGQLKLQLAQESNSFGPKNRHLKDIDVQIHALDEQIAQELEQIKKRAQADFELAKQTEDGIRQQFDQQQLAAGKLNETAIQFAVLSEEAFSHKRLYEDLYTKLQEANVSAGIQATNITVVDPARSQSQAIRPRPVQYVALGALFGLFVGLAAAYTVDNLDRTVSTPDEVEEITGKPVIGIIPELKKADRTSWNRARVPKEGQKRPEEEPSMLPALWMVSHPDSSAAEAFRTLRTSIMLSRAGGGPKVILITSCVPDEGKTTVATNLAAAFAQHNKKVIVVEADMRRPRMERVLNVSNELGLSNVLTGSATCEEAIVRAVQLPTLDILAAGPHPPNSSEILGSAAFDDLLQYLRSHYDFVLLDSPPALLVTDPVLISTKVDAAIWVSRAGLVARSQLARAAHLIERNRMPVIGFVVNRMSRRLAGYGYGYGYEYEYYGSYYGKKNPNDK